MTPAPEGGPAGEAGYTCVWEYEVPGETEQEFLTHYAPGGSWTRLFRRASGYVATELYRDRQRRGRFLTVDHWLTEAAYREFRSRFAAEYEALDLSCGRLTRRETPLGELEAVLGHGSAPRAT